MSGRNHGSSSTVGAEIASNRVSTKEAALEKGWPMITDHIADLLADLVFVMLTILLLVWVGLWIFAY